MKPDNASARDPSGMPVGFALCHGWGFDAQVMAPLQAALRQRCPAAECLTFDLGFGGKPHSPPLFPDRQWIAVGHSYGFAWLAQQPVAWRAAIAINGFTRFCRQRGQAQGTPTRLVDAMLARLGSDHAATVRDFYQRCGTDTAPPPHLEREVLHEHLLRLRALEMALPAYPVLALATDADAIVPLALARACFAGPGPQRALRELSGDHTSLLRQPQALAAMIAEWTETIDA